MHRQIDGTRHGWYMHAPRCCARHATERHEANTVDLGRSHKRVLKHNHRRELHACLPWRPFPTWWMGAATTRHSSAFALLLCVLGLSNVCVMVWWSMCIQYIHVYRRVCGGVPCVCGVSVWCMESLCKACVRPISMCMCVCVYMSACVFMCMCVPMCGTTWPATTTPFIQVCFSYLFHCFCIGEYLYVAQMGDMRNTHAHRHDMSTHNHLHTDSHGYKHTQPVTQQCIRYLNTEYVLYI